MKKLLVGGLVFMFSLLFSAVSYAQPVLNSFDPLSGPVGTVVNVNGINLLNTTDVTFDGVPAIFSVANSGGTRIVATVPLARVYRVSGDESSHLLRATGVHGRWFV